MHLIPFFAVVVVVIVIFVTLTVAVVFGVIHVVRGIRALINPSYYEEIILSPFILSAREDPGIGRMKIEKQYTSTQRRKIISWAFYHLFGGFFTMCFGIYFLVKFLHIYVTSN